MQGRMVLGLVSALLSPSPALSEPNPAPSEAQQTENAEILWPGKADWAPVAMELHGNKVCFRALVGGQEIWAFLDTGAEYSLIDAKFAAASGLDMGGTQSSLRTIGDKVQARHVANVRFEVPKHFIIAGRMIATDLEPMARAAGRPVKAVLGRDYLNAMAVGIAPKLGQLYMMKAGALKPKAHSTFSFPLTERFEVDAMVNGQPVTLMVDTGSDAVIALSPRAWKRVVPADAATRQANGSGLDGVSRSFQISSGNRFDLGPISATNVHIALLAYDAPASDGILGMPFLERFATILDTSQRTLILTPNE